MTPLPKEPVGAHPLVQSLRLIIRCLRERSIVPDLTQFEIGRTVEGKKLKIKASLLSAPGSGGNVVRWG